MAAVVMPPRSAVHVHPNLTVGSRIQLPTPSPIEPFKYGVIRWIGKLSTIQGLVAGVEMVSAECVRCSLFERFLSFMCVYVHFYVHCVHSQ